MSAIQAMERSYGVLKQMLREGLYPPGARLEANRISQELGVSMTPVRDVLHRLVGERLVDTEAGDGFRVPRLSETDLRDLYEWNSAMLLIALRTSRSSPEPSSTQPDSSAERAAQLFGLIASTAPNQEVRAAITSASDRLHPFRMLEDAVLEPIFGELDEIALGDGAQAQAIRRYHVRRMKAVPALLRRRDQQGI